MFGKSKKSSGSAGTNPRINKATDDLNNELKSVKSSRELDCWIKKNGVGSVTFGEYLLSLLEREHMSQGDLVRETGKAKSYISDLISGKKKPRRGTVLRIILALGVKRQEADRLLQLSGNSPLYPRRKEDSVIIFGLEKGLSPDRIQEMLADRGLDAGLFD